MEASQPRKVYTIDSEWDIGHNYYVFDKKESAKKFLLQSVENMPSLLIEGMNAVQTTEEYLNDGMFIIESKEFIL